MSTSIHDGLVSFEGSLYGAAADPADTVLMRDAVANGLLHIADSYAQVRVNYSPIAAAFATNERDAYETIDTDPVAGQWYLVGGASFGDWPLTCHADGSPYVLRVRLGVAAQATDAGDTHTYRVVIAPIGRAREELPLSEDHVFEVSGAASTTVAWATGTSQGTLGHATLMTLSASTASTWIRRVAAYDAVSSASPSSVEQVLVGCHVFAKTTDAGNLPRVHALSLTEYVGL